MFQQTDQESPSQPDPGFDKSKVVFTTSPPQSKSKNLIFFCHGGGFIALTSKSYEVAKNFDFFQFNLDLKLRVGFQYFFQFSF